MRSARARGTNRMGLTLLVLIGCLGCGNAVGYLKGPMPASALPEPRVNVLAEVVLLLPGKAPIPEARKSVAFQGKILRIVRGVSPEFGFRMEILRSDGALVAVNVRTYTRWMPDLVSGRTIEVAYERGDTTTLRVEDEGGVAFFLASGPSVPGRPKNVPFDVTPGMERIYSEMFATEDGCRQTHAHVPIHVRVDRDDRRLAPGEELRIMVRDRPFVVVHVDSRMLEESDCSAPEATHASFYWMRLEGGGSEEPG